jgi:tetratricopeptide (TPR) repeat protein
VAARLPAPAGRAPRASGNADEAQQLYERILSTRSVPWARLGLAKALYMQRRYAEAEDILQALVGENELYVDAYDWLSRTREAAGELEAARNVLTNAMALSPHRVGRLRRLGELSIETGDHEAAEKVLAEVVRKGKYSDFRDPEDHVRLLQAQLGRGDTAQAEATIRDLERSMAGLDKTRMHGPLERPRACQEGRDRPGRRSPQGLISESDGGQSLSLKLKGELARACFATKLDERRPGRPRHHAQRPRRTHPRHHQEHAAGGRQGRARRTAGRADQHEVRDLVAEGARKAQDGDFDGAVQFMLSAVRKMPGNTHVLFNATLALLKHIENCGWNERFAEQARSLMERARAARPGQRPPAGPHHLLLQPAEEIRDTALRGLLTGAILRPAEPPFRLLRLALDPPLALRRRPRLPRLGHREIASIAATRLPPEARETLALIRQGGPYPYRRDGITFQNREGRCPKQPRLLPRIHRPTPGSRDRGARRIVTGGNPPSVFYYSNDHYRSFRRIQD